MSFQEVTAAGASLAGRAKSDRHLSVCCVLPDLMRTEEEPVHI